MSLKVLAACPNLMFHVFLSLGLHCLHSKYGHAHGRDMPEQSREWHAWTGKSCWNQFGHGREYSDFGQAHFPVPSKRQFIGSCLSVLARNT